MPMYPVEERSLVSSARKPVPACTVAVTASIRPDGDTSRVRLTAAYVTALENAGLIPLIVPPLSSADAAGAVLDSVAGLENCRCRVSTREWRYYQWYEPCIFEGGHVSGGQPDTTGIAIWA